MTIKTSTSRSASGAEVCVLSLSVSLSEWETQKHFSSEKGFYDQAPEMFSFRGLARCALQLWNIEWLLVLPVVRILPYGYNFIANVDAAFCVCGGL